MTIDELVDKILKAEGWPTVSNSKDDRGGLTKGGITLDTFSAYLGKPATSQMLINLSENDARTIYRHKYIILPNFDKIAGARLRHMVVDAGVLHGTTRATRWLQEACGAEADGDLGPKTLAALDTADAADVMVNFLAIRCRAIARLVSRDPTQVKWLYGWMRRATKFILGE